MRQKRSQNSAEFGISLGQVWDKFGINEQPACRDLNSGSTLANKVNFRADQTSTVKQLSVDTF